MFVNMDSTKNEILEHLAELEIEANPKMKKADLFALVPVPPDGEFEDGEVEPEPKAEAAPPPALVDDDTVTVRGTSAGGVTKMKRSEYLAKQAEKDGKNAD